MGGQETLALLSLITGNVGLFLALVLTLCGLYNILVARNTSLGVIMLAVGVMLPFTFNIISGLQSAFCPILQTVAGANACGGFDQASGPSGGVGSGSNPY
jgi:hypothetical protein